MVGLYLAAMAGWIYGHLNVVPHVFLLTYADRGLPLYVALVGAQLALGLLLGRWWAVAVVLLPVVLAVPAGYPVGGAEAPIWVFVLVEMVLSAAPIVAIGVAIRKLSGFVWRRARPSLRWS